MATDYGKHMQSRDFSPLNKRDLLEYSVRFAWYQTKLRLNIEPKSDKNFLAHDFAVRLVRGLLPSDTRFTIAGRGDGVGMQGMARLSGLLFSHVFGASYVDTPFSDIEHVTNRTTGSVQAWEKLLNLGRGEMSISSGDDCIIDYVNFLAGRETWSPACILRIPQCFWLYRRHPNLLDQAAHIFSSKYDWCKKTPNSHLSVAVHVRRGDVGANKNSMRYTENSVVLRTIAGVERTLKSMNLAYSVTVHSQGAPADFSEFTSRGYALNLEEDAIIAMRHFIESDVFLMSKSSFSYLSATYNKGVKLYLPTFNPCLPSWIKMNSNGDFNSSRLARAIELHLISQNVSDSSRVSCQMNP